MILDYIKAYTQIRYYDPIPCHTSLYFSNNLAFLRLQQFCLYFHTTYSHMILYIYRKS